MAQTYSIRINPDDPTITIPVAVSRDCCVAPIDFTLTGVSQNGTPLDTNVWESIFSVSDSSNNVYTLPAGATSGEVSIDYDPDAVSVGDVYSFNFDVTSECKEGESPINKKFRSSVEFTGIGSDEPCTPGPYFLNFNFGYKSGNIVENMVETSSGTVSIDSIQVGRKIESVSAYYGSTTGESWYTRTGGPTLPGTITLSGKTITLEVVYVTGMEPMAPNGNIDDMTGYGLQIEYN